MTGAVYWNTGQAVFQCVWPIVDETMSLSELIAEATAQLDRIADQAHALVTGPPLWDVRPAAEIVGWAAYAPGSVLICRAPAEDVRVRPLRGRQVDEGDVVVALDRNQAPRRPADRAEAVRRLVEDERQDAETVAARLGMTVPAVEQSIWRTRQRRIAVPA